MLPLLLLVVAVDVDALAKNPGVAKVERIAPGDRLIIHIRDWHIVAKDAFGESEGLKGEPLEAAYAELVKEAAAVHRSKLLILEGQPEVFQEGMSKRDETIVAAELRALKAFHHAMRKNAAAIVAVVLLLLPVELLRPDYARAAIHLGEFAAASLAARRKIWLRDFIGPESRLTVA